EYIQYTFSEHPISSLHSIPLHRQMKLFVDNDKAIPLYKLADAELCREIFDGHRGNETEKVISAIGYIHSGSFVTYLVDTYGLEKFELIYNQPDLSNQIKLVYEKSLDQLELEWLDYI